MTWSARIGLALLLIVGAVGLKAAIHRYKNPPPQPVQMVVVEKPSPSPSPKVTDDCWTK